jgi:serralysin
MPSPLSYSPSWSVTLTNNPLLDSLVFGTSWGDGVNTAWLSYSFITPGSSLFARNYSSDNEYQNSYALTSAQKTAITSSLGTWAAVANIKFTQVSESRSNVGDLRFGGYAGMDSNTAAWGYFPGDAPVAGDVWIGYATNNKSPIKGTYDYMTFMHEIGHALGLKHPFSTSPQNSTVLADEYDDVHYTIMSYTNAYSYEPTTPMLLDILAIQKLYGANNLWQTGNNTYKWATNQSVFETLWDSGGTDTIDASNQAAAVTLNLNEGQFSNIGKAFIDYQRGVEINNGLAIAFGTKIENAIGSIYNDNLIGNDLDNVLDGRAGADIMTGGLGNDTYIVDNVSDIVVETSTLASEIDTVLASVSYVLSANVEVLTLTGRGNINGAGNELDNILTGNAGNNLLEGGAGNDVLDGGAGADTLIGGTGDDTYIVDNIRDEIIELEDEGHDLVKTSISYTLGANIEDGQLLGSAALKLTGNSLNNTLIGNSGANILDGGLGADILDGGAGNDTYYVDDINDVIIELGTSLKEIDNVFASVNWTLRDNLENLTLTGSDHLNGTGNALNNRITGNAGNNILDGGAGIDTLVGGLGNDTYIVDNIRDVIIETSRLAEEIDTVMSSVNWTLGANLENLTLTGSDHLNGTGNALNNLLIGNAGDNLLDGKTGLDTMRGGDGNDTYVLDQFGELALIEELANQGDDTLNIAYKATTATSIVDLSASNLRNVENVTLLGAGLFQVVGNDLDNTLIGNAQANTLEGGAGNDLLNGGAGADIMKGGIGDDTYIVDNIGDQVIELEGEGHDLVQTTISYTLADHIEDGQLLGSAALKLTGNSLNNTLIGNSGANILDGGLGADILDGGAGNDTYYVDDVNDVIIELGTSLKEIDNVFASVNWTLGDNLENLTLTGTDHLNGTGNALNNRITGNAGNNILDGGAGIDTLVGGLGNDTYIVDNIRDVIVETSKLATEIDTVISSVNWTLGANLENLTLSGNDNLNGTGNTLNNVLIGNAGDNLLDGKAGLDTMEGGDGNDTYVLDQFGELGLIKELTNEGNDTLNITYNATATTDVVDLSALNLLNVENVNLIGSGLFRVVGNDQDNTLIGNAQANILEGGAGNDVLNGGAGNDTLDGGAGDDILIGGLGTDTLTGGTGADRFVFNLLKELGLGTLRDVITDFSSAEGDKIDLTKIDANLLKTGLDAFTFIGSESFTGAGQLRFDNEILSGNINGNLAADFEIHLVGVTSFTANDLAA